MNGNDFVIENKFMSNDSKNNKSKSKKWILLLLLLFLVGTLGFLIYEVKFSKKDNNKTSDEYEEYDPNYPLESDGNIKQEQKKNVTSNITEVITSNVSSNISSVKSNTNNSVKVTGIKVDKPNVSVSVGKTTSINATISPNNASNKGIIWSSGNTKIAKVDQNGKVTGVQAGKTMIIATTRDGSYKATTTVTVTDTVNTTTISISPAKPSVQIGNTTTLTAAVSNKGVATWRVGDSSVVSLSASSNKATVKCLKKGTSVISATAGGKTSNVTLTCNNSVSFANSSITLYATHTYGVKQSYAYVGVNTTDNYDNLKVTISNPNVVKTANMVSQTGMLVATGENGGTSKITITTSDGQSAVYTVNVKKYTVKKSKVMSGGHAGHYYEITAAQEYYVYLDGKEVKNVTVVGDDNKTYPSNTQASSLGLTSLPDISKPFVIVNNVKYPAIFVE